MQQRYNNFFYLQNFFAIFLNNYLEKKSLNDLLYFINNHIEVITKMNIPPDINANFNECILIEYVKNIIYIANSKFLKVNIYFKNFLIVFIFFVFYFIRFNANLKPISNASSHVLKL